MANEMIGVIGGSGFIGTRLVKRLLAGHKQVKIIDKRQSTVYPELWVKADVCHEQSLVQALEGCTVLYNLAAEHKDNVRPISLYYDVNVGGAYNVCNAAKALGIRHLIFTSSVAVYGFTTSETDESWPLNPFNDYGKTKKQAEAVYKDWFDSVDRGTLTIVRPTVVFGEDNRGNVYNLFKQIVEGKFLMIGKGRNLKSMAYVENVAAFLEETLSFEPGYRIFNYVDKPDFSMNELVNFIYTVTGKNGKGTLRLPYWLGFLGGIGFDFLSLLTGKEFPVSAIRIKKFCADTLFSSRYIHSTRFNPPVSLQEGIGNTLRHEFLS